MTFTSRNALHRMLLATIVSLSLFACDDSLKGASGTPGESDAGATPGSDGGVKEPDASSPGIPLIAWVDLLVEDFSAETSPPDTVNDKVIVDDEQSGSFEKFFAAEAED